MKHVVSAKWLYDHKDDSNLVILDSSPESNVSGLSSKFEGRHIPNAIHFNLKKDFSDPDSEFPNTLQKPLAFEKAARKLGINKDSVIVVYDNLGVYTSPRVWWLFKVMGHEKEYVLNGGLPDWVKNGFETQSNLIENPTTEGNFTAKFNPDLVVNIDDVKENIASEKGLVIDARSSRRFFGTQPEPREGLRSGHIPKSINIPYQDVLEDGKFKDEKALREIFNQETLKNQPLYFSCGSGLTACITLMAADMVNENPKAVYDGSWTEWGQMVAM